ncbi:hypothetical protein M1466_02710 [Candidatus Dependentiae bacterium]|nr:hypothetical protein [Candidatus Dependentiae bacterium]
MVLPPKYLSYLSVIVLCATAQIVAGRSVFRPSDPHMPVVTCKWEGGTKEYTLKDWYWSPATLFDTYQQEYVASHLLPTTMIEPLHPWSKPIDGKALNAELDRLVRSIQAGEPIIDGYTVLKSNDYRFHSGLLVLRSNNHPVVVKLYSETPKNMVHPYDHGFEQSARFIVNGSTRHMLGFTRVPTAALSRKKIAGTRWESRVTIPRKWYWFPQEQCNIVITTKNVGRQLTNSIVLPAVYAIVCDAIEQDTTKTVPLTDSLELCSDLQYIIDPQTKNFIIEEKTGNIGLIDTESFEAHMGFYEPVGRVNNYIYWYIRLIGYGIRKKFCMLRPYRYAQQQREHTYHRTLELCN